MFFLFTVKGQFYVSTKTVLDVLAGFFDNDNTKPMIHVITEGNLDE